MRTNQTKVVEEVNYGVYAWEMPNGSIVQDDEGHILSISSMRGNTDRMSQLAEAVRMHGINEGRPIFFSGARKVTDDEYDNQRARLEAGLIPDEYDIPAMLEEQRAIRESGG